MGEYGADVRELSLGPLQGWGRAGDQKGVAAAEGIAVPQSQQGSGRLSSELLRGQVRGEKWELFTGFSNRQSLVLVTRAVSAVTSTV